MWQRSVVALDDGAPRHGIESIDEYPYTHYGNEPVACLLQVIPQFGETDVEGEKHHHHAHHTEHKKYVVKRLLCHSQSLSFSFILLQNPSWRCST